MSDAETTGDQQFEATSGAQAGTARLEQNLPAGITAGLVAALLSAVIWAGITVATGYQIGYMAIGVGALVGFAVRRFGKGYETIFGVVGGGMALLGCLLGNMFAMIGILAKELEIPFAEVLGAMTPSRAIELLGAGFDFIDLLFYGIAAYEGYIFAINKVESTED